MFYFSLLLSQLSYAPDVKRYQLRPYILAAFEYGSLNRDLSGAYGERTSSQSPARVSSQTVEPS